MQIIIEVEDNIVYIKSENFGMTFFREVDGDLFGYDGPEMFEEMCIKIASAILDEK